MDSGKYTHTLSWRAEVPKAKAAIQNLCDFIATFMRSNAQSDRLDIENIRRSVGPMVDSVIRNPHACLWSTVMKPETSSSYDAALRSAVFSCVLGRQLGLPRWDLCSLAIGVYPVGAMVELSAGEVAIVAAQSSSRRLRPIVVVLLDSEKSPCREDHYINLEETTHSADGSKLDIVKNLEPNAFGIDRGAIKQPV